MNDSFQSTDPVLSAFMKFVPEVRQGIVEIKAIAHDPNGFVWVAVDSKDSRVNPVVACCKRVTEISGELVKRLVIIFWSSSTEQFIRNSLTVSHRQANLKRKIPHVLLDWETRRATVIVDERTWEGLTEDNEHRLRMASALVGWVLKLERKDQP